MTVPAACPTCGAYSIAPADETSRLLLVCDVLVVKALERVGNRIVKAQRARFREMDASGRPLHEAYLLWPTLPEVASKSLVGAWDVVPALLDAHSAGVVGVEARDVAAVLDEYVLALVAGRYPHDTARLAAELSARLGIDLPVRERRRVVAR